MRLIVPGQLEICLGAAPSGSTVDEVIYSLLHDDPGVSPIVGVRIYPQELPQESALAALVYERTSLDHIRSNDGATGLATALYDVTSWAETFVAARELADAARLALDGYSGTVGTVKIGFIMLENELDILEEPLFDERRRCGVRQQYTVSYDETIPVH